MRAVDRRLLRSSRAARSHVVVSVALGAVAAGAVVVQAVALARVVARVFLDDASLSHASGELIAFLAAAAVRAVVSWGFEVSGHLAAARAMSDLRARLVEHVLRARPSALEGERSGELATAAVQGVDALDAYFSRYLPQTALAALVPLTVLAWTAHVDLVSAAIMAVTVPVIPVFMVLIGRTAERHAAARWRALSRLSGRFLDVVRGLPTLRAFGRAEAQGTALATAGERYRRDTMATLRIAFLSALVLELAAMLGTAMVAVVLGVRLTHGGLALEDALAVLILVPELYLPLRQLGAQFHASADGVAGAERIFELLDTPAAVAEGGNGPVPRGTIRFEAVSFAYPARPGLVLEGFDLEVRPGERLALVGASGAGKSTVAALLLRLADPTAGRVTVGGRDLRELDAARWRAGVAWVPQRPHLSAGTVADNIRLADPEASDVRVRSAATAAGIRFGLDLVVGEGGLALSAGERRRIALARAFLRDAPLLVLDEPTAHLDSRSAAEIGASIERLSRGRTTLLITHDAALAWRAGRVVDLSTRAPAVAA
jgi:thiol reductant ABC exporter CydD subunit